MGRTGLIGRGALWQWGPNHQILAVCTRWRRTDSADGQAPGFLYVEGKKVMEFIAVKKSDDGDETSFGLPGVILCSLFNMFMASTTLILMLHDFFVWFISELDDHQYLMNFNLLTYSFTQFKCLVFCFKWLKTV